MGSSTRLQRVVDGLFAELYGLPLRDWIADQRDDGMPWRRIEKELYVKTNGVVDVSHPTLIAWFGDLSSDTQATEDDVA